MAGPGRDSVGLGLILLAYLALGVGYSVATPAGEGPDEPGHIAYVQFLLAHHRLPLHGEVAEPLAQQVKHPPLYYFLGAVATVWADYRGLVFLPNEQMTGDLSHLGVPTAHRHTRAEAPPYAGPYLAVHVLRWLTLFLGALGVWATWQLARLVWPAEPGFAHAAAATMAFLPQFLFIQSVVNNDGLANPLAALALTFTVRVALFGARRRDLVALGAMLGLGLLTKLTLVASLPVAGIGLLVAARRRRSWRPLLDGVVWMGGPVVLLAGWWFARNALVNGDLLGWGKWADAASMSLRHAPLTDELPTYFYLQFTSFLGRFGWTTVPLPDAAYQAFGWLCLVALVGLAWSAVRPAPGSPLADPDARVALEMALLTIAMVYLSVFRLAFTFDLVVAQGRYLFTALPAGAVLFTLGLVGPWPRRLRPWIESAVGVGVFAFAVFALGAVLAPAFRPPPRLTAAEIAAIRNRVDVDFGTNVRLLGYDVDEPRRAPGQMLEVTLYWETHGQPEHPLVLFVQLLDAAGDKLSQADLVPSAGRYPSSSWLDDWPSREVVQLPVPERAAPGNASVILGWYLDGAPDQRLEAVRPGSPAFDHFRIDPILIVPRAEPQDLPQADATDVHR